MITEIIGIISNQQVVEILYKQEKIKRKIQIYTFGESKSGNLIIRTFQQSGYSQNQINGWKLFCVKNIVSINPIKETFFKHTGYKKDDKSFKIIIAQIK